MSYKSESDLLILHTLRIKGFVQSNELVEATSLNVKKVEERLNSFQEENLSVNVSVIVSLKSLNNCEELEYLLGDLNGDLIINVTDIIQAINIIMHSWYDETADMNFDGIINIQDIIYLVNIILNNE